MNFGIGSNKEIKNDVAPSTFLLTSSGCSRAFSDTCPVFPGPRNSLFPPGKGRLRGFRVLLVMSMGVFQAKPATSKQPLGDPNVRKEAAAMPGRILVPAIAEPAPSANPVTVEALLRRARP